MSAQEDLRDEFLAALKHIGDVLTKTTSHVVPAGSLSTADIHTIAEGLFLFAFTHWEHFTRGLLIADVGNDPASALHRAVDQFHDPDAPLRLANAMLQHPDHPHAFVDWSSYSQVMARANEFLDASNRFAAPPLPRRNDLEKLKRVRNAIAHRSEKAWISFLNLCQDQPFPVHASQMKGITPGRFLVVHLWNGQPVIRDTLALLENAACHLVP